MFMDRLFILLALLASVGKAARTFGFVRNDLVVQTLTSLANLAARNGFTVTPRSQGANEPVKIRGELAKEFLIKGIRDDFEAGYLFSGAINAELYDEDCQFTDPTLTFRGISTFQRNIKAIRPLIDRFVGANLVTLYSLEAFESAQQDTCKVVAKWRMEGALKLPWSPMIDVQGVTEYRATSLKGGRIVEYFEQWTDEPTAALLRLLKPAAFLQKRLEIKCLETGGKPAVLIPDLVESLLALCARPNVVFIEVQERIQRLEQHDTDKNKGLDDLEGTSWALAYTNSKGGSNGRVGPLQGLVTQIFGRQTNDARLPFINRVEFAGGALTIDQHGQASARADFTTIALDFVRTDVSVLGIVVASTQDAGQGFWSLVYSGNNVRVIKTNAKSTFILTMK